MSHTVSSKIDLLARVRRIRGQVEGIERALDREQGCAQVLHLIAGVRGAVAGLMAEVIEQHVRTHLVDPEKHPGALDLQMDAGANFGLTRSTATIELYVGLSTRF